jgi:hypothetical protein
MENILRYVQKTYTDGVLVKQALEEGCDYDFEEIKLKAPKITSIDYNGDVVETDAPKDSFEMTLANT